MVLNTFKFKKTKSLVNEKHEVEQQYHKLLELSTSIQLENTTLRNALCEAKQEIHLLRQENENASCLNIQLNSEKEAIEKECSALTERESEAAVRIKELEKENKRLLQEVADIKEEKILQEQCLREFGYQQATKKCDSSEFWNNLYINKGNSGTGSYNRLAEFKAEIVNRFISEKAIQTVGEIGCGDGNQLSLIHYPNYVGIDVSEVIIKKDREKFRDFQNYSFFHSLTEREKYIHRSFDMTISMDVIFHLLEDDVFTAYIDDLFNLADKYVVIYSSNHEEYTPWPEYRHRNFTGYVSVYHPEWELIRYIPNKYPYRIGQEETTSASDFYIYQKKDTQKR